MSGAGLDSGLCRPALYNPSLWSRDEVRGYYVARTALLDRFVADIKREKASTRPQHRLIVGQRGMGKSTLLRRIAVAVEDEPDLNAQWLPLNFPEEQYNVASLADFWLNCLDALGDQLEARGEREAVAAIDAEIERLDRKDGEGALQALLRAAGRQQRRLLLLVDNIDLVFERIKKEDWAFREALQAHPELLLIGASSRVLEAAYDYKAAFYDFFKVDELRGLSEDEMRETILNLARQRGANDVIRRVESDPGRLRVLHTLTGGNPRTAVLLYGVLLKGNDGDVRSDLEGLLDEVTPLYKARFDELAPQSQQLVDKLALNWDPMTARQLADQLGWTVNLVSAQLDRLTSAGVVEKTRSGSAKRILFQVAERFFNIWYLMRASRRVRRKLMWLVEFLRAFFSLDELQSIARRRLAGCPADAPLDEQLAPDDEFACWLQGMSLIESGRYDEASGAIRRWLKLVEKSEGAPVGINSFIPLLQTSLAANIGPLLLEMLDATEVGQRYRPIREALAAAIAGNAGLLNDVAPEVRKPAVEILAIIAPDLVKDRE